MIVSLHYLINLIANRIMIGQFFYQYPLFMILKAFCYDLPFSIVIKMQPSAKQKLYIIYLLLAGI